MRRPAALALAVALASGLLAGCQTDDAKTDDAKTVVVALPSTSGRWSQVAAVLRSRLEDAGLTADVRSADDDIPTQVRQVTEILDAEPDVVIVAPVDAPSLTPVLARADPDIEVISLGS